MIFEFLTLVLWQCVSIVKSALLFCGRTCLHGVEALVGCEAAFLTHYFLLPADLLLPIAKTSWIDLFLIFRIPTSLRITREGREILLTITALSAGVLILSIPFQRLYNLIPVWYDDFTRQNFKRMVGMSYVICGLSIYTYLLLRIGTPKGLLFLPGISGIVGCELSNVRDVHRIFVNSVYNFWLPLVAIAWVILQVRVRMIPHRIE